MVFGAFLWILISLIPLQTNPEFVVREIRACCHHRITFKCVDHHSKIAIIQARYMADDEDNKESIAAVIDPSADPSTFLNHQESSDHQHHPFLPSSEAVSLWDLDIKFAHEIIKDKIKPPHHINTLPEWHPDHSSHSATRRRFLSHPKVTLPPKYPFGMNFSSGKVIEMPQYEKNFLDEHTIWNQPLFPLVQTETGESNYLYSDEYFSTLPKFHQRDNNKCMSYQTLMSDSQRASSMEILKEPSKNNNEPQKPIWHFKDLRPYFNKRCSGKSQCDVYLLRNKERDQDITQVCQLMPYGRIIVKYLCYNASSDVQAHAKCNVDVTPAGEGFVMNPGYPELYPGDQPCQWRLHVPQQKILLIFFDISLRIEDKSKCKDELIVTDQNEFKVFSTCGDQESAIAVLSESHVLNITLNPQSRLAFPKRGYLAYYKAIGCVDPISPSNSYYIRINTSHAFLKCDPGFLWPDTGTRDRVLFCSPLENKWDGAFPYCQDIRNYKSRNATINKILLNDPSVWPIKYRDSHKTTFYEYGVPILVIFTVFLLHGIILYFIWRRRNRLEEELENQTNQEMERICAADSPEESIFSFPDSIEDLWDHDELDLDPEEDHDRTLTTLTVQTDTPPSSVARRNTDHHHHHHLYEENRNGNGHLRFYHNGVSGQAAEGNGRPNIGYVNGNLLPVTFNGYFRTTSV